MERKKVKLPVDPDWGWLPLDFRYESQEKIKSVWSVRPNSLVHLRAPSQAHTHATLLQIFGCKIRKCSLNHNKCTQDTSSMQTHY